MKPKSTLAKTIHGIAGEQIRTVPANLPDVPGVIPPAGLDPRIAECRVLIRRGFPLPLDERRSPDAARIWRQTLSRQLDRIVPSLRERPEQKNGALAELPESEHIILHETAAGTTNTSGAEAPLIAMAGITIAASAGALATSDWDCTFYAGR